MLVRWRPTWGLMAIHLGITATVLSPPPARAQTPDCTNYTPCWTDVNYKSRRPLTVRNFGGAPLAQGDVVAFSYSPKQGIFDGKTQDDGKDVHIFYENGGTVVDVPQVVVPMGPESAKVLFSLAAPLAAGTPAPFTKGTDSSTFDATAGQPLLLKADDLAKVVPLPFPFPWLGQDQTAVVVDTNGWLIFDTTNIDAHYAGFNTLAVDQSHIFVAPFATDLDTRVDGGDVYEDVKMNVPGQEDSVTFRWAAQKFLNGTLGTEPATANFSVTLFRSGKIRFNYGNPCKLNENKEPTRQVEVGLAVGDFRVDLLDYFQVQKTPAVDPVGAPQALDFSNHPAIVYTPQTVSVAQDDKYYVYYNAADTDDGQGSRPLPDPAKLIRYDFKTAADTQGWVKATGNPDAYGVVQVDAGNGEGVLQLSSDPQQIGGHPMAIAGDMPDVQDQTVYARLLGIGANQHEVTLMARAKDNGSGYGLFINGFKDIGQYTGLDPSQGQYYGPADGLLVRTDQPRGLDAAEPGRSYFSPDPSTMDYGLISVYEAWVRNETEWNYAIMKLQGTGASTRVLGKSFAESNGEPGGWYYQFIPDPSNEVPLYSSGKIGLSGYDGGADPQDTQVLDWAYVVTNAHAEDVSYVAGAEEAFIRPPGLGTLKGIVTDAAVSTQVGFDVGIPLAQVVITPQAGGSPIIRYTNAGGNYTRDLQPGTYNIKVSAAGYQVVNTTSVVTANQDTTLNVALVSTNLITNPSFETEENISATGGTVAAHTKPVGWWRKNYDSRVAPGIVDPNAPDSHFPYVTDGSVAHTGTHSVGIVGSKDTSTDPGHPIANNIFAWQTEGSAANVTYNDSTGPVVSLDDRGKGPLVATRPGDFYLISVWVRKDGANGAARLRIRDVQTDNDGDVVGGGGNLFGNGATISQTANTNGAWVQLSTIWQAQSNFLSIRLYGVDIPANQAAYFDDVFAGRVTPPTYVGTVKRSDGSPAANGTGVAIAEATRNGMADPVPFAYDYSDANGNWAIRFLPTPGVNYTAQAWFDKQVLDRGNMASASVPVNITSPTALTNITYDAQELADIALKKPIATFSSEWHSGNPNNPNGPAVLATDGDLGWWSSDQNFNAPFAQALAQFIVVDLGASIDFQQVKQITMHWRDAPSNRYSLRVSNDAPNFRFNDPDNNPDWATVDAGAYGQQIYMSPTNAGARNYNDYTRTDIVTQPAGGWKDSGGQPIGQARYVELLSNDAYGILPGGSGYFLSFLYVNLYEILVEVPTGIVNGRVIDPSGQGVGNAVVGIHPDSTIYATTDPAGNYRINNVPVGIPISLSAHKVDSANTVYAVSQSYSLVAPPGQGSFTIPSFVLGNPVPNAIGAGASASLDRPDLEDSGSPAGLGIDKNFASAWVSSLIFPESGPGAPAVDDAHPLGYVVDMGATKTVNTVVIAWRSELATAYAVDISSDAFFNTFKEVYLTNAGTGGYSYSLGSLSIDGIDAITFPPASGRYLRIRMTGHRQDHLAIREVMAALAVPGTPPIDPFYAVNAMKIAGGLMPAPLKSGGGFSVYDPDNSGTITVADAAKLLRSANGR